MEKTVFATIKGTEPRFAERFVAPSSAKYGPIILFPDQKLTDDDVWSSLILFKEKHADGSYLVELSYLSEAAPFERLVSGKTFSLFEGAHKVAEGVIL